jgi:hypothetical protein
MLGAVRSHRLTPPMCGSEMPDVTASSRRWFVLRLQGAVDVSQMILGSKVL